MTTVYIYRDELYPVYFATEDKNYGERKVEVEQKDFEAYEDTFCKWREWQDFMELKYSSARSN